jgi:hypothetical protein
LTTAVIRFEMPLVTAAVVVVLALAYTLAGFFLAPRLIKTQAPRYVRPRWTPQIRPYVDTSNPAIEAGAHAECRIVVA